MNFYTDVACCTQANTDGSPRSKFLALVLITFEREFYVFYFHIVCICEDVNLHAIEIAIHVLGRG